MTRSDFSRWLLCALVAPLAACDRYFQQPSCHEYFRAGDTQFYVIDDQGIALDQRSGKRWFRCQAGERLVAGQCVGQALELSQAEALQYATEFSEASGRTWRLPTVREMGSLKQDKCHKPAINTQVFPSIQINNYWTSSISPSGDFFGCTSYTFNGHDYCREPVTNRRPFLLLVD